MAFIRSYSSRGAALQMDQGDPFSLRIPKKLRKWQPGRQLKKLQPGKLLRSIAAPALSLIPGGSLLSRLAGLAEKYSMPVETLAGFARSYGYDIGDPGPSQKKRKGAAAGTKAKAAKKAEKRAAPKPPKTTARRPSGSKQPIDWGAIGGAAAEIIKTGAQFIPGGKKDMSGFQIPAGLEEELGAALGGGARGMRLPGMGGRRRSVNPTNVKALRRSLRRVESFRTLVKRVEKQFPSMRPRKACSCGSAVRGGRRK